MLYAISIVYIYWDYSKQISKYMSVLLCNIFNIFISSMSFTLTKTDVVLQSWMSFYITAPERNQNIPHVMLAAWCIEEYILHIMIWFSNYVIKTRNLSQHSAFSMFSDVW